MSRSDSPKSKQKKKRKSLYRSLIEQIKEDKKAFVVYILLSLTILTVIIRSIIERRFENVFTGVLASALLLLPPFIEKSFRVKLPTTLEILAYAFVFCAEILGEIGNFYQIFPFWDVMLHTFNGFMFAAFGFCLVDIFNKNKRFRFALSPIFLAIVAFCFSMTIGVLWEFFEYTADSLLHTDMQKDTIVSTLDTVSIPNDLGGKVTHITDIEKSVLYTADGQAIEVAGHLDVGLADTMEDLFVNFIGAAIFSVIGYFYVKHRGKGPIAGQFIPVFRDDEEEPAAAEAPPPSSMENLSEEDRTSTSERL
ncbi:MAG: hypothetical protein IJX39_09300 [Clostridia bacterium]|nr:hypothetical protein [Clostridia bacterium]